MSKRFAAKIQGYDLPANKMTFLNSSSTITFIANSIYLYEQITQAKQPKADQIMLNCTIFVGKADQ